MPELTTQAGERRFAMDHDWAQVPATLVLGITHAIREDAAGNLHVARVVPPESVNRDPLLVFAPDGRFLRSYGPRDAAEAHGLVFAVENGREVAYFTDLLKGLYKLDPATGEVLWHVYKPPFYDHRPGLAYRPSNVAVSPSGRLFFADGYGAWFILELDPRDGRQIAVFGGAGVGPNAVLHPHGIAVDARGAEPELVVAENSSPSRLADLTCTLRSSIGRFTLDGERIGRWPLESLSPRNVFFGPSVTVVPDLEGRVYLLDAANRALGQLGAASFTWQRGRELRTLTRAELPVGEFVCPHDAIEARDGTLYVAEWVTAGRLTKLTPLTN